MIAIELLAKHGSPTDSHYTFTSALTTWSPVSVRVCHRNLCDILILIDGFCSVASLDSSCFPLSPPTFGYISTHSPYTVHSTMYNYQCTMYICQCIWLYSVYLKVLCLQLTKHNIVKGLPVCEGHL